MGEFVLTLLGEAFVEEMIAGGDAGSFTRVEFSDFDFSGVEVSELTGIESVQQVGNVESVRVTDAGGVEVMTSIENSAVLVGYYVRSLGLYAKNADGVEILFGVCFGGDNFDYMPAFAGKTASSITYKINVVVSGCKDMLVEIDPAGSASMEYVSSKFDDVSGNLASHVYSEVVTERGVHGLRCIDGALEVYENGEWVDVEAGGLVVADLLEDVATLENVADDILVDIESLKNELTGIVEDNDINEAAISENAQAIVTNSADILKNASAIDENSAEILKNAGAIDENGAAIAENKVEILKNAGAIGESSSAIADNAVAIGENKIAIDLNAVAIGENSAAITKLNEVVGGEGGSLAELAGDVAENSAEIVVNSAAISENSAEILKNASAIDESKIAIDESKIAIDENKIAIGENAGAIGENAGAIDECKIAISGNSFAISENAAAIASNADGIASNLVKINANSTALSGKQAVVTGGASTITDSNLTASRALVSDTSGKVAVSAVTSTELGYVDGVTSNIQTQLNAKQATIAGGATTITSSNLTVSRALVSDTSGKVAVSAVTSTELGYVDGVTSNIQTQLNAKQATIAGGATTITTSNLTTSRALVSSTSGKVAVSAVTSTELGYLDGVTSNIQTQLDSKVSGIYDVVIRTQTEFNALVASSTWLGAKSVCFVGDGGSLVFTSSSDITIPATVFNIKGVNNAILNVGLKYATKPVASLGYSIEGIFLNCGVSSGFTNCVRLRNCYTASDYGRGTGFVNCDFIVNCNTGCYSVAIQNCRYISNCSVSGYKGGMENCSDISNCNVYSWSEIGLLNCQNISNCLSTSVESTAFHNCSWLSNCQMGSGTPALFSGTNLYVDSITVTGSR